MTQVDQGVSGLLTDLYIEDANAAVGAAEEAAASWAATAPRARAGDRGRARLHGVALPGAQLVR
jgi:acyl-CoA reductase-like NAD-dependent aldehyde dehydrogenase